jgi:phosphate transport system substrate-binding protein
MKNILLAGLVGFSSLVSLTANAADAPASLTLTGSGSSFVKPIMDKWADAYGKADASVKINYAGGGSGKGQTDILANVVEFAGTDGPMSDAQLKSAKGTILHLPVVAGAVVIVYNLPGVTNLKLDGPTLADIYLGKILKWDDKAIAALNPGVKLPSQDITTVHRADKSGTTYIFTDYLSNVSADWKKNVGTATGVEWPGTGQGQSQSAGVAGQVQKTPGAIGYVELIYALANKISFADMKNANGKYITASLQGVSDALSTATIPADYRFSFVNAPGDTAYPISGVTWLLVYQEQKDAVKGKDLVSFLKWIYTDKDAQKMGADLFYAPIPDTVVKRLLTTIDTIKVPAPAAK